MTKLSCRQRLLQLIAPRLFGRRWKLKSELLSFTLGLVFQTSACHFCLRRRVDGNERHSLALRLVLQLSAILFRLGRRIDGRKDFPLALLTVLRLCFGGLHCLVILKARVSANELCYFRIHILTAGGGMATTPVAPRAIASRAKMAVCIL